MKQAEKEEALRRIDMMIRMNDDLKALLPMDMRMAGGECYLVHYQLMQMRNKIEGLEVEDPQSRPLTSVDTGLLHRVLSYQKENGMYCPIREVNILEDNLNFLVKNGYLNWNAPVERADRVYITSKGKQAIGMPEY